MSEFITGLATEVRGFIPKEVRPLFPDKVERVDFTKRAETLESLLRGVLERKKDEEELDILINGVIGFLGQDPLSDQQAGCVARFLRDMKGIGGNLSLAEEKVLVVGDWREIGEIACRTEERRTNWEQNLGLMKTSSEPLECFRAMEIDFLSRLRIRNRGLLPQGIQDHGSLQALIQDLIGPTAGWFLSKQEILEKIPFSKALALLWTWVAVDDDFGFREAHHRLGISTTPEGNIPNIARFGKTIFRITLPEDKFIAVGDDNFKEKEETVLFFVPPSAIKIYHR